MRSFIHKTNLDERHKSHVAPVFPAHPSKLTRPVFLNDILSPSTVAHGMTPLAMRPRSPNVLFNIPTSSRDFSDDERDSGRPKRRGGVVKLKKLNDKIKFSKAMRRRSCCCKWCGGISEFEAKHQDIVGNVDRVIKARTVLAAADFFSENTSIASSARDALREVLPEATILRQKNQKKARDKYIAHRKMISGLDGLKSRGKSSFSSSFNAKSSNRKSIGSRESLTQGLDDSGSGLKLLQPDLAKLEEEKPGEAESPQQDPHYPAEFPPKRSFSRSTTEPNLFKRRSKGPVMNAKRGSDLPRPSQLEVDLGEPPSALTQAHVEVSPFFKNMKAAAGSSGSRSSTPQLKSPSPQILKVANIVQQKKNESTVKILPFSPNKSIGFIKKEPARTRSKVTSIKLDVGKDGKTVSVHSLVKVPPLSKTPTGAENQKHFRTCSSIQLKTEGTDEGGVTRTLELLVPTTAVVSPKDSRVHTSHAMTSTSYKSLSKILKKSQDRAVNVYTKDKLLIQEKEITKRANLKYQSHSHIQRGNLKSLSHFPGVQIPKLNMVESRMTSPQRKVQTLIPIKFKDEKERMKANDKKATWLIGNFGGTKKNVIMKSFCLDQTSLAELKINKKRKEQGI